MYYVKIVTRCYCYTDGLDLPYDPVMLIRDKSKYFDVEAVKAGSFFGRVKLYLGRLKSEIAIRKRLKAIAGIFKRKE